MTADTAGYTRAQGAGRGAGVPEGPDLPPPALSEGLKLPPTPLVFPPPGAVPVQVMPWNKRLYPPLLFVSVRELPRVPMGASPGIHPGQKSPQERRGEAGPGRGCRWGQAGQAPRAGRWCRPVSAPGPSPGPGGSPRVPGGGGCPTAPQTPRMPHCPPNPAGAAHGEALQGHERHGHLPCAFPAKFSVAQLVQRRRNNGEGAGRGGRAGGRCGGAGNKTNGSSRSEFSRLPPGGAIQPRLSQEARRSQPLETGQPEHGQGAGAVQG